MVNVVSNERSYQYLLVPDFTISVCGSSCNSLFFGLIPSSILSLSVSWQPLGMQLKEKAKERECGRKTENYMNCRIHRDERLHPVLRCVPIPCIPGTLPPVLRSLKAWLCVTMHFKLSAWESPIGSGRGGGGGGTYSTGLRTYTVHISLWLLYKNQLSFK